MCVCMRFILFHRHSTLESFVFSFYLGFIIYYRCIHILNIIVMHLLAKFCVVLLHSAQLSSAQLSSAQLWKSTAIISTAQLYTCLTVTLCKSFLGAFCFFYFGIHSNHDKNQIFCALKTCIYNLMSLISWSRFWISHKKPLSLMKHAKHHQNLYTMHIALIKQLEMAFVFHFSYSSSECVAHLNFCSNFMFCFVL